ncbi:hypothetical protein M440DRAFT_92793 [Trichoderma longibrachiatum ATCC 18648]|uniref:Uncharacterized protein n=1 Tax=Trichoderma longibrachiatum ATCC 18648 TaxID=983965 RepID=A0A2T4CJP9_TRILO|nr:hypothetical protein M440DRAFT_92793 [Trichoderma longibrachiatum ATCC 18648]
MGSRSDEVVCVVYIWCVIERKRRGEKHVFGYLGLLTAYYDFPSASVFSTGYDRIFPFILLQGRCIAEQAQSFVDCILKPANFSSVLLRSPEVQCRQVVSRNAPPVAGEFHFRGTLESTGSRHAQSELGIDVLMEISTSSRRN